MTIIRRWQTGLEAVSQGEFDGFITNPGAWVTNPVRTSSRSLRIYAHSSGGAAQYKNVSDTQQVRVGTGLYIDIFSNVADGDVLVLRNGSTNLIELELKATTGEMVLKVAGVQQDISDDAFELDSWTHIGLDCYINSSSGWAYVYLNGLEYLSFDGDTGSSAIDNVVFGTLIDAGTITTPWFYDDLYIDDSSGEASPSPLSMLKFYRITPNANGNYSQWLGSDGDSTNNYALVDEVIPSDADYVITTGTNKLDSYNMGTFTLGAGEVIQSIIPIVRTKRTSSTEQIILGTRVSSTDLLGTIQDPDTSFGYLYQRLTGTPTGADWFQSDLDGVELLIASTGTY